MAWYTRVANVFRPRRLSAELSREIDFHIAERTDDLVERGLTEPEAHRIAMQAFGGYTTQKLRTRDMNIAGWLEALIGDLRYGARQLRRAPAFAFAAVVSLALGVGANSAMFQLINTLGLRELPVASPGQLAAIGTGPDFTGSGWWSGRNSNRFTYAQYTEMGNRSEAFSGLMAFGTRRFNLSEGGEFRFAEGLWVTPNFLEVLGVTPLIGSWVAAGTDPRDCSGPGALLNYDFWQREYAGDPEVIGRDISLNGRPFPVLAVTPPSFFGVEPGHRFDVALPLCADALLADDGTGRLDNDTAWWLTPMGRLNDNVTVEEASAEMRALSPSIFEATLPSSYRPDTAERYLRNTLTVEPASAGVSNIRRQFEEPLFILLAITALVLLIACANLANLLLARASARQREMALRQAVGASRRRLVAQLMSESALLAVIGTLLGMAVGYGLGRGLVRFIASSNQDLHLPMGLDWRVFAFTAAMATVTCLLFGLVPALRGTRTAPADAMRGGRSAGAANERHGLRRTLVVTQFALSLILLVGALLFVQSLRNLETVDTGMDASRMLMARVLARLPHLEADDRVSILRELEARVRSLPDVESAATVSISPFSGNGWDQEVRADEDEWIGTWFSRVSPGYVQTMGIPLLAGRDFSPSDDAQAPQVAIINERLAAELFGEANPVGRTFLRRESAGEDDVAFQIVGVVGNTRYGGLREETRPITFLPVAQETNPGEVTLAIRARGPYNAVMAGVRREMARLDGGLLVEFRVFDDQVANSVLRERLVARLSTGFGVLALCLSTVGLYGVMAYMVARRRTELGVRLALGASVSSILGLVLREAGGLVSAGLVLGLLGAFALTRYAETFLYGLEPNDTFTLAAASLLLAATGVAAALLPARRAARLDRATVLREE